MGIIKTIREEIERRIANFNTLHNTAVLRKDTDGVARIDCALGQLQHLLSFLDTLQEPDGLHFLPMVRLVEMIRTDEWCDRGKRYTEKIVSALENEGYSTDARLVRNHIKYMDGEDVPRATMDKQEPEFPATDEEMEAFLASHPKVEVPEKYKTPDWLFKKLEQEPEVDLEEEIKRYGEKNMFNIPAFQQVARHFAEWGAEHLKK